MDFDFQRQMNNYTLSSLRSKTIVKTEKDFVGCNVNITNCRKSHIYILSRTRSVTLQGITDSIVVAGVTEKVVTVENCENLTLITICGGLQIKSSKRITVYTCCNSSPQILGENEVIRIGPYNTFYSTMNDHIKQTFSGNQKGIRTELLSNFWNHPIVASPLLSKDVQLIEPKDFIPFVVPFKVVGGSASANPCELPQEYKEALQQRSLSINSTWNEISKFSKENTNQSDSMIPNLWNDIELKFKGWMIENGCIEQVKQLIKLESEYQKVI